jgi:hypothetical protein
MPGYSKPTRASMRESSVTVKRSEAIWRSEKRSKKCSMSVTQLVFSARRPSARCSASTS